MLTKEENRILTEVSPGTPAGELLRRYWYPVAVAKELTDDSPTRFVRVLGEDLVVFKDKSGRFGLLADRCSHRGASLLYGRVEERGIACAYHGWLYDTEGNCLETPPEPADSKFRLTIKHKAYPVQQFVGLLWAYMGPPPIPVIPRYDVWARRDGFHSIVIQPILDCNWMQVMENSVDGPHAYILHQEFLRHHASTTQSGSTRGFTEGIAEWRYDEVPIGIMKTRVWKSGRAESHPLIFPNILRQGNNTQIRVPIDNEHTWHIRVGFSPSEDGESVDQTDEEIPVKYDEPYKEPANALHPWTRFDMLREIAAQDFMAWETQGPIAPREHERLGTGDRGVVAFRQMLKQEIEKVQNGQDPIGVVRDPDHEIIDTGLAETLRSGSGSGARSRT